MATEVSPWGKPGAGAPMNDAGSRPVSSFYNRNSEKEIGGNMAMVVRNIAYLLVCKVVNPSNAKATFVQSSRMQSFWQTI